MITVGMFRKAERAANSDYAREMLLAGDLAGKDIVAMRALTARQMHRLRLDVAAQLLPVRCRVARTGAETWDLVDCACCLVCGMMCECGPEADCACEDPPVIARMRMPNAGEVMDAHQGRRLDPYALINLVSVIERDKPADFDLLDYRVYAALDWAMWSMTDSPLAVWAEWPSQETSS